MHGTQETQLVLPTMYKQVDILREVSATLSSLGYKRAISTHFFTVVEHNVQDNFTIKNKHILQM